MTTEIAQAELFDMYRMLATTIKQMSNIVQNPITRMLDEKHIDLSDVKASKTTLVEKFATNCFVKFNNEDGFELR